MPWAEQQGSDELVVEGRPQGVVLAAVVEQLDGAAERPAVQLGDDVDQLVGGGGQAGHAALLDGAAQRVDARPHRVDRRAVTGRLVHPQHLAELGIVGEHRRIVCHSEQPPEPGRVGVDDHGHQLVPVARRRSDPAEVVEGDLDPAGRSLAAASGPPSAALSVEVRCLCR